MTTTQVTTKKASMPFSFEADRYSRDEAIEIINGEAREQNLRSVTGEELARRRVNVNALAQRILEAEEFSLFEFNELAISRYGIWRLNDALESTTCTQDIDTAFYRTHEARGEETLEESLERAS